MIGSSITIAGWRRASIHRGKAHRTGRSFRWASHRYAVFDATLQVFSYILSERPLTNRDRRA
jgi:hypothetical protein